MESKNNRHFYITTPIFYPNANLHLGHAYTTTVCDIFARYNRLAGKETYFLTGSDENTEKVVRAAKSAGQDTKTYLDGIVSNFKDLFSRLEISYDQFIRTNDEMNHYPGVIEIWNRIAKAGDLEKRSYHGLYCVGHEAFITEKDFVDGKCPEHNESPQMLEEENYFFKLSKYTEVIKQKIESGEFKIVPDTRRNEILALLQRGLEDVSFSRPADKVSVGIPVPDDLSQKIYVWADALTNYISALGFGRRDDSLFKKFWPANVQVVGKDILRFHAAIWLGMLLSAGLPLPKTLFVHGFITSGGKKMSKSLGNVIDPLELIEEYGAEAVRYYLVRHISPFEDGDITKESFKEAYNANLANGLGNLVARVMQMAEQNRIKIPASARKLRTGKQDSRFKNGNREKREEFEKAIEEFNLQKAMTIIWENISALDGKIQKEQPFKLIKTKPEKGKKVIEELLVGLSEIAELLKPFMPETAKKIEDAIAKNQKPDTLFPRKE